CLAYLHAISTAERTDRFRVFRSTTIDRLRGVRHRVTVYLHSVIAAQPDLVASSAARPPGEVVPSRRTAPLLWRWGIAISQPPAAAGAPAGKRPFAGRSHAAGRGRVRQRRSE